jgi:CBS-domain-containing membrane protein
MMCAEEFVSFVRRFIAPAVGGGLGVGAMVELADFSRTPLESIPFVTSIILVISAPESPQAQPSNVFGGHIISASIGVAMLNLLGDSAPSAAATVGLAIAAMLITNTLHPPAGINAFIAVTQHMSWKFIFAPVMVGAATLIVFAWLYHRWAPESDWPSRWNF